MAFCFPKTNIKNYLAVSQKDETEDDVLAAVDAPSSQTMDEVKGLRGGGKGQGSIYFTKGLPILDGNRTITATATN